MYPPMAKTNLHIEATEFECLVRDWIIQQGGEWFSSLPESEPRQERLRVSASLCARHCTLDAQSLDAVGCTASLA